MHIGILLFHDVSESEIAQSLNIFAVAKKLSNDQNKMETNTLAKTRFSVVGLGGLVMTPAYAFTASPPDIDVLVIPGGSGAERASKDAQTRSYIQRTMPKLKHILCVGSGALILGEADLLTDLSVSTSPSVAESIWKFNPSQVTDAGLVENNNGVCFVSHPGLTATLCLHFLTQNISADISEKTRHYLGLGM